MPIRKDAAGRWHAEACHQRRRLHRVLPQGATEGDAKLLAAELLRSLHHTASNRAPSIPGDPPLTALLADYTERHAYTLRSPETARHHAFRIGRWCEGRRASEARHVAAAIAQDMAGHYAPATINRSLSALSSALRAAWERGTVAVDYSTQIKRLPERNARHTWLSLDQVQRIADRTSPAVRAAIWISVLTGCRRGEALALRPDMIGRDSITLPAGATKTLRTRTVPIIAPLRPWLKAVGPDGLGVTFEAVKSGFRRAREAAGMPGVQFRDLRRSTGTLLIQSGVPLHHVSQILGHTSTQVTERVYAHLAGAQLKASMQHLSRLHRGLHQTKKRRPKAPLSA